MYCPEGFFNFGPECFKYLNDKPRNFEELKTVAVEMNSHIAEPLDVIKIGKHLFEMDKKEPYNINIIREMDFKGWPLFIDLKRNYLEKWRWHSSQAAFQQLWPKNKPGSNVNHPCAVLENRGKTKMLSDYSCEEKVFGLIEYRK